MIALLTGLFGLFSNFLPEVSKQIQDKRDKSHELKVLELQIQAQKEGIAARVDEVELTGYAQEAVAIQKSYQSELKYSGKYAASVRPTVTYLIMALYMIQKLVALYILINNPLPWQQDATWVTAALSTWTVFDEGLLGAIIGFWFGSRILKK